MVIGRGRRREHPQPTICTTTTKKKVREKSTKNNYGKKSTRTKLRVEKLRDNDTGEKYGNKIEGKSHMTAGDVTSGSSSSLLRNC